MIEPMVGDVVCVAREFGSLSSAQRVGHVRAYHLNDVGDRVAIVEFAGGGKVSVPVRWLTGVAA